ncbi:MAG TPA: FAD-dependent monooxygenase [Casimicrobiaceae bacterium]|nr:FAD-dependent monooxygenase [Casimicrobiaceae bacterium]
MLHDLAIVGAGPVGAMLALAVADAGLDVVALDARPLGAIGRGDRSLALSHGGRLILERVGVWSAVAAARDAVTPITAIDISQRGGFGRMRLDALEQGLPALGYVVSYRALQAALDAALERAGNKVVYGATVTGVRSTPSYGAVETTRAGKESELCARLVAVADGGGELIGLKRHRHDYGQVAVIGKLLLIEPHGGVAFERFTPEGPVALLPEGEHYGFVWTTTPARSETLLALSDTDFLAALEQGFGLHTATRSARLRTQPAGFEGVGDRRAFPLRLDYADHVVGQRVVLLGNAAQALHPVAGQGFNLGMRDAYELAQELLATPRDAIGARDSLAAYARRRRADRVAGIAFTHGLLGIFGSDAPLLRWPRGLALTMLDVLPAVKRVFTRAMSYGMH